MNRVGIIAPCLMLTLSLAMAGHAQSGTAELARRLETSRDCRVRVQSALALGHVGDQAARLPLERALDSDPRASVRAAAAVALGVLGDRRAVPALERHEDDASLTVRQSVQEALAALRGDAEAQTTKVLLQVGYLRNLSQDEAPALATALRRASRTGFDGLVGVRIVTDPNLATTEQALPVVKVTGILKELTMSVTKGKLVCEARVEYVLHRMPGQILEALVRGNAKATVSASVRDDQRAFDDLRRRVVEAAVASAMRRTPEALRRVTQ
ncbi:MAG: HEAT repeat domain-containing protein [Polyangiaceae bacterium]|nr:HEAT repeat domain-containing protein [Polyangiaceae bacterium]